MKRVDSSGSELNDFTEENGKKVYNVRTEPRSPFSAFLSIISLMFTFDLTLHCCAMFYFAYAGV